MSVDLVRKAMANFLATSVPEVLCIEGRWGTGKTYAWDKAVEEANREGRLAIKKYAQVSLFGLKDAADIIQAIYANTVDLGQKINERKVVTRFGSQSVGDLRSKLKQLIPAVAEHTKDIPHIAGLGGVVRSVLASLVSKTVVCIDDFERKSGTISVNEVMGTIAQLRDVRSCKVVLILNENSLSEGERDELQRFGEKVFNRSFKFLPTPTDSGRVAFTADDDLTNQLRDACEELGIVNIRVLEKIKQFATELSTCLKGLDPDVSKNVIRSLVVIVWSMISPAGEGAPDLSYLVDKREKQSLGVEQISTSSNEDRWGVLLEAFGFAGCDDFDKLLIESVARGFFDAEALKPGIDTYLKDAARVRAIAAMRAAYEPFHASFDDDADEVVDSIYSGYIENLTFLSPMNLSSAVTLLKDVGHADKAGQLLDRFIAVNDGKDVFDLDQNPFGSEVRDPDVRAAFATKAEQNVSLPTAAEAAKGVLKGGWGDVDEQVLAKLSEDDFIDLFRSARGDDRRSVILGCLEPRKFANATDRQRSISSKATAALVSIGSESPLNAHRLAAFQVQIPKETMPKPVSAAVSKDDSDTDTPAAEETLAPLTSAKARPSS